MSEQHPTTRNDVKSDEEWSVVLWLQEAKQHGLVESWAYEPEKFVLSEKQNYVRITQLKTKQKHDKLVLHKKKTYTPDFAIIFTEKGLALWKAAFPESYWIMVEDGGTERKAYIDIKGTYNPYQNDDQLFDMKRMIMHDIYGFWTAKVIPFYYTGEDEKRTARGLFTATFAPSSMRQRKDGRGLTKYGTWAPSITEFVNDNAYLF